MRADGQEAAIELRALCRSYRHTLGLRSREVLRGLDLCVQRGEVYGLVGPNGSGKSTLMRILAGIDRPSAGSVRVLGEEPRSPRVRSRIAFLPEDSPFPRELTATATLELLGTLQGMARAEVRARGAELLEQVGLSKAARVPLGKYSRGMARRFGLAQAWLHRPELILLDEPTAGLDAEGFQALDRLLEQAAQAGSTVLFCSHLVGDMRRRCERVGVLLGGRLRHEGRSRELLARPGCWQLELEGLDGAAIEALGDWVRGQGGELKSSLPSGRSLLELYSGDA